MEEKYRIISEISTLLTYLSTIVTMILAGFSVFLGFLGTYSLGFGVIFAAFTCWINWRVQRLRVKLLLSKNNVDI